MVISRKHDLWDALYERFALDPSIPSEPALLLKYILPVTDADWLVTQTKFQSAAVDLTGSTNVDIFTVPAKKLWRLQIFYHAGMAAAGQARLKIGGTYMNVGTTTANEEVLNVRAIDLVADDAVAMLGTGNAGDGAVTVQILYRETDLQ